MRHSLITVHGALSVVATCLVVAGCAPAPTGPTDAGQPDPAYWGLADKACFRFTDSANGEHVIAVVVDDNMTFAGVLTYQLQYLTNGQLQGTDWVSVTPDALLLYQHSTPASISGTTTIPDSATVFTPPPYYLVEGLVAGETPKVSNTTAATTGGMTSMTPEQFTVNVEETDMIMADGMTLSAPEYLVTVVDSNNPAMATTSKIWFVPQIGIVQIGQPNGAPSWVLTTVDQNVATMNCY